VGDYVEGVNAVIIRDNTMKGLVDRHSHVTTLVCGVCALVTDQYLQ